MEKFSKEKMAHHYCNIAKQNWVDFIKDKKEVNQKKYIYILRNLFCCKYFMENPDYKLIPPLNVNKKS
jgi:predicted nucleotidyltransferase